MRIVLMIVPRALLVLGAAAVLAGTGCGSDSGATDAGSRERLQVTAAFYPLQWASERVGGDHVVVRGLTKPGTEPHDLELTPRAVGELGASDVVVYLQGFQPAVDGAVSAQAPDAGFDVSPVAELSLPGDPHFWVDPVRLGTVATALGETFARQDPANAAAYRSNAAALVAELRALDGEFRAGLAQCESREIVTGHAAFGYLADRYAFDQRGITGISPDAEPDAAALRELTEHVRAEGVTTVYAETLVSPALAETIARETGARVALLDPLEGITDSSAGANYLEVMRANLRTLRGGQRCT
jgi:zinc transport system substrate-binding protein